jgi:hypothetical protein
VSERFTVTEPPEVARERADERLPREWSERDRSEECFSADFAEGARLRRATAEQNVRVQANF